MAKRSRRRKKGEDVRPADHRLPKELAGGDEKWVVSGPVFAKFDAQMDGELETLVSRWIHTAAPSSGFRRVIRQAARRASGQV